MTPKFASVLLLVVFCALSGTALIGCTRGLALHRGVLDYDRAVSRAQAEMLLLNVARARYDRPLHFTTVTGIAATFEYRLDAALGAELVENPDLSLLLPSVATGISESPTASIVPIHGEDFAKRLLTPFEETKFAYFIEQGEDPDIILRLMASEILIGVGAQQMRYRNDPGRPEEYRSFRQYALHLAMLGQTNQLHVGPITYQQTWPIPPETDMALAEYVDVLEQGYELKSVPGKGLALTTEVAGRIAITNYALTALPNEERQRLQE
ncbi:MAG: hypothetical protein L0H63_16145, partial [Nitrococcus sp.]|nr:hypothetical protein [Nitrococcus sp.]